MTQYRKTFFFAVLIPLLWILWLPGTVYGQFNYQNEPAIELFNNLQEKTTYRFLYRESLVSSLRLTLQTQESDLINDLTDALEEHQLTIKQDSVGTQLMVVSLNERPNDARDTIRISGQVVDQASGDRLPFSTISWQENNQMKGVAATNSGTFNIKTSAAREYLSLRVSYIGYHTENITVNISDNQPVKDLTIRLRKQSIVGSEIVVMGSSHFSSRDSSLAGLVRTDRFSPLGDGNAVRALQILPAIQPATAMNDGLSIRGSAPDGFHLELDGIKIFNQSHLFGMLDSFNEDAIINSGFYYGVAPADVNAPVGGKLSLTTKNGSLNDNKAAISASNTSVRSTLEGPLKSGQSSWLVSGRISTMNQLNWMNNDRLIQWGLDVNRSNSGPDSDQVVNANLITPLGSDVRFFDLHGKVYLEGKYGSRTIFSGYFGGDRTSHNANRITRSNSLRDRFQEIEVETQNKWNNFATSVQHQHSLSDNIYSLSMIGVSAYETDFSKDDFIYTNTVKTTQFNQTILNTSPLANKSTMNRLKVGQTFHINSDLFHLKTGAEGYYHRGEYLEESFDRQRFYTQTASFQTDLFAQMDLDVHNDITLAGGIRTHYYANGRYLLFSPRAKVEFFNTRPISIDAGYSKNYQFINRISFSNAVTADIWILPNENQPPTSAEQFSAGVYTNPFRHLFIRIEGYKKFYKNLRLHELNASTLTDTFTDTPWFFQNDGTATGIESIVRFTGSNFSITQTYTLSSVKLKNDLLNNGDAFYAPWDRTHSSNTILELPVLNNLSLFASYTAASGNINFLPEQETDNETRLPAYKRLDLSALYTRQFNQSSFSAKVSVFNVLDRKNTWYKEFQPVIVSSGTIPAIRAEMVDVYDLGFQPSFEISFSF